MSNLSKPTLINCGCAVDDRGKLTFANEFSFEGVKRFYMVENHQINFIRAWHGHRKEGKYVLVVSGAAIVSAFPLDHAEKGPSSEAPFRTVLTSDVPKIAYIPPGYFNGFKTLRENTRVMFFSTSTLEESAGDDIRLPHDAVYPKVWEVEFR